MPDADWGESPLPPPPCALRFGDVLCVKAVTVVPNQGIKVDIRSEPQFFKTKMSATYQTVLSVPCDLRRTFHVMCVILS